MKVSIECKVVPPGHNGNAQPRLIFTGRYWKEDWGDDIEFCIHGIKMRWMCDECGDLPTVELAGHTFSTLDVTAPPPGSDTGKATVETSQNLPHLSTDAESCERPAP